MMTSDQPPPQPPRVSTTTTMMTTGDPAEGEEEESIGEIGEDEDGPNIIVLSEAGKPIFSRYGDEEDVAVACGLIQALLATARLESFGGWGGEEDGGGDDDDCGRGSDPRELRSIRTADGTTVVFLTVGALTLVSIDVGGGGTEAYLQVQLEYVYSQIIFTLTDQVQSVFRKNASFDLRSLLGATDDVIRGLIDMADHGGYDAGRFLTSGVEPLYPLDPGVRDAASHALASAGDGIPDDLGGPPLFAILCVGSRLVTLVQPRRRECQIHVYDLQLILNFVGCQPGLLASEAWVPLCLPRLDPSGFVYAYTNCLHRGTGLSLVLVSVTNDTDRFELFRGASASVRATLGLPPYSPREGSVIRAYQRASDDSDGGGEIGDDRRPGERISETTGDEGGGDELDKCEGARDKGLDGSGICRWGDDGEGDGEGVAHPSSMDGPPANTEGPPCRLVGAIADAKNEASRRALLGGYCEVASAMHFVLRCDVPVHGGGGGGGGSHGDRRRPAASSCGRVIQCVTAAFQFPLVDDPASMRRVWDAYQRLSLRLRNGSASWEAAMEAMERVQMKEGEPSSSGGRSDNGSIGRMCAAQGLMEAPPEMSNVTYLVDGHELFVGLSGQGFEFYAVLPGTTAARTGTTLCARLVRKLMCERSRLFLDNPLTWSR